MIFYRVNQNLNFGTSTLIKESVRAPTIDPFKELLEIEKKSKNGIIEQVKARNQKEKNKNDLEK